MAKFIAFVLIIILQFICSLGNYWLTFGLWPRSWGWFIFFVACQLVLLSLSTIVSKSKS